MRYLKINPSGGPLGHEGLDLLIGLFDLGFKVGHLLAVKGIL